MRTTLRSVLRLAPILLPLLGTAGCSSLGLDGLSGGTGSTLSNLVKYGSTTVPPLAAQPVFEAANCPSVLVIDGHSNIKSGSSQVSIANIARECIERQDGSIAVKVGVEGRALLGPGGGSNRFDVPVAYVLRRGDRVITSRVKRVSVSIAAGQAQAGFVSIEGDLIVPKGTGDFDIYVGLGAGAASGGGEAAAPRGRRRAG